MGTLTDNPAARFVTGFLAPFRSLGFLNRNPGLYRFILLPFLVNCVVFVGVVSLGFGVIKDRVMAWLPSGDAWYWAVLQAVFLLVAVLVILVLVFFTFTVVGNLIAAPFNDLLSERVERILLGETGEKTPSGEFLEEAVRTLGVEARKIGVYAAGMAVLLVVLLVPLLGAVLYPGLSIAWTICFLVVEYTGYPFSRRRMSLTDQRRVLRGHLALMAGFGTGVFCVLAIPFLQLLCIPLGVVGATRLLCEPGGLMESAGHPARRGEAEGRARTEQTR